MGRLRLHDDYDCYDEDGCGCATRAYSRDVPPTRMITVRRPPPRPSPAAPARPARAWSVPYRPGPAWPVPPAAPAYGFAPSDQR
ncbi:hypothetical protein [Streptomyces sp. CBMA29]|uniref:hypothetical protein n=1 Tax=Streptomyces sp. CBMA29 TaxID=1896314 RepID=UPI001661A428|nr:hypothetical protein [Streptomyces sp. CBMA29]